MSSLAIAVRALLLPAPEVSRLSALRRGTPLFSQGQSADALFFIEDGLFKLTRTNAGGDRIIVSMCGPGGLVGEEALSAAADEYQTDAEALTPASAFRIPKDLVMRVVQSQQNFSALLIDYLVQRRLSMTRKVELLCLHDVEYRILYYLAELATLVQQTGSSDGSYQLPITQAELADLIGATRETTSTTLNQLERRGLVKLSRRLLTVPSTALLRDANLNHVGSREPANAQTA